MCRFVVYQGPELTLDMLTTRPIHSIIKQSTHAQLREEPLNGDGFGVAWYAKGHQEAIRFRSVTPAWSNQNLQHIARFASSKTILAHVRAASPGLPVVETNCHPFVFENYSFMHNGYIPHFATIKRELQGMLSKTAYDMILGTTDSEHLFALCLSALGEKRDQPSIEDLCQAMTWAIKQVDSLLKKYSIEIPAQLNMVLSNGEQSIVSRYASAGIPNSLFWHDGAQYTCIDGQCFMKDADRSQQAIIVASEPLSKDSGWEEVPACHIVGIDKAVSFHTIEHSI